MLHDPEAQRPTRIPWERRVNDVFAAGTEGRQAAALFVRLDGLEPVTDRAGHDGGDELLRKVADRLRSCVRDCDTVTRLSGDEFVVVLAGAHPEADAAAVAERALQLVTEAFHLAGGRIHLGASIGVALGRPGEGRGPTLLRSSTSRRRRRSSDR